MRPCPGGEITLGIILTLTSTAVYATPPPPGGGTLPEAYHQRIEEEPRAFSVDTAVQGIIEAGANRAAAALQDKRLDEVEEIVKAGGIVVKGERFLPIIPVRFNGMSEPVSTAELHRAFFGGTESLRDYYSEVSYGLLNVMGEVLPWQELSRQDTFYEGEDFDDEEGNRVACQGLCTNAKIGDLLKEALDAVDPLIDFSKADLTGPKGVPDGFVDAVAIVHSERGGECPGEGTNIWSHQGTYESATKTTEPYVTQDGVKIDTYIVVPALDCERTGANRIGVVVHEFGHTLGLPDLYDTDKSDGQSDSVGNWDLMGTGAWGGDSHSPEKPTHLSAWSKAQLGWVFPDKVEEDSRYQPARITNSEIAPLAFQIAISKNEYYLVENRQRQGYDSGLPGDGLLIWRINKKAAERGLKNNKVNAGEPKGVSLVQSDDENLLDGGAERGDAGDPFPGLKDNHSFMRGAHPSSVGKTAACEISDSATKMTARLLVTTNSCDVVSRAVPAPAGIPVPPAPTSAPAAEPHALSPPEAVQPVELKELSGSPKGYLNRPIRLIGKLVNLGVNYFTDRRIALQDAEGHTIAVRPWLPLEAPPGEPPKTPTLASYLDKTVSVVGEVKRSGKEDEDAFVLDVTSAEVIPPP